MPRIIKQAKGTYTSSTITVDGSGRVITAADGAAGGLSFGSITTYNSPGTFTADPNSKYIAVAAAGGGGGSGSQNNSGAGNTTNFGNLLSVPGGTGGNNNTNGSPGTYDSSTLMVFGQPSPSGPRSGPGRGASIGGFQSTTGGNYSGNIDPSTGAAGPIGGAGSTGGVPGGQSTSNAGGCGGCKGAYFNAPQYAPAGVPVTVGTGGTGPHTNGGSGRVVVMEFTS